MAHFADGQRTVGDILVGADGVGSRVRRQYLPDAEPTPAGVVGLANKLLLTEATRAWVPERLQQGMNVVSGTGPYSLFTAAYQPPPDARTALAAVTSDEPPPIDQPYVVSALVTAPSSLPRGVADLDAKGLRGAADALIVDWHPTLRRLIAESVPDEGVLSTFRVAPESPPWPSSHVTLLGDALHTVPATGGLGGNTALRDARRLTQLLTTAEHDTLQAISVYEHDLRGHGYAAIREALGVRDQLLAGGVLTTLTTRTWLRLCRHLTPLRRRSFGETDTSFSHPRSWEQRAVT